MASALEIALRLRDQFVAPLKRAEGALRGFAATAQRQLQRVGTFVGAANRAFARLDKRITNTRNIIRAFIGFQALRSLFRFATATAEIDDQIGKLSQRLGLSTEFISELRFAAEQSGVTFKTLEAGLQRAVRRLGEFRDTGKGTAKDALEALGGGLKEAVLRGDTFEKLLPRISDRLKGLATDAERVVVMFKLVDTEGVELVQLFGQGSAAVEKLREEARRLNLTIGAESARTAAEYNDAVNRLRKSFEGLSRILLTEFGPGLSKFINDLSKDLSKVLDKTDRLPRLSPEITARINRELDAIERRLGGKPFFAMIEELQQIIRERAAFQEVTAEFRSAGERFREVFTGPETQRFVDSLKSVADAFARPFREVSRPFREALEKPEAPAVPEIPTLRREDIAGAAGLPQVERMNQELAQTKGHLDGVAAGLAEIAERGNAFNSMRDAVLDLSHSLESNLVNGINEAVSGTKSFKVAFRETAVAILKDIQLIIIRLLVVKLLAGVAGAVGARLFPGAEAAGAGASAPANVQFNPNLQARIPLLQRGGTVFGPASGFPVQLHKAERVRVEPLDHEPRGQQFNVSFLVFAQDAKSFDEQLTRGFTNRKREITDLVVTELRRRPDLVRAMRMP